MAHRFGVHTPTVVCAACHDLLGILRTFRVFTSPGGTRSPAAARCKKALRDLWFLFLVPRPFARPGRKTFHRPSAFPAHPANPVPHETSAPAPERRLRAPFPPDSSIRAS